MGKILIKNKKGTHEKPAQAKKSTAAVTDQATAAAATSQDPNCPSQDGTNPTSPSQENQGAHSWTPTESMSGYSSKSHKYFLF